MAWYRKAIVDCEQSLAARTALVDLCRATAMERIEAVRKSAMRAIDEHTTRRFLGVNMRRGLIRKLDRLHQTALAELDSLTSSSSAP